MRQRSPLNRKKQVFLEDLPPEIIFDILSRLPVLSVFTCKCVCKSWLVMLETDEFVKAHISKGVPGLAVNDPESCKIFEFVDVLDLEEHEFHYIARTEFDCNDYGLIQGSANGLLLLTNKSLDSDEFDQVYLVNPFVDEYLEINCCYQEFIFKDDQVVTYGFGAGRITGDLKVVRVFHDCVRDEETEELLSIPKSQCQVYTLGTGTWRNIAPGPFMEYNTCSFGALFHGNLHWVVFDLNGCSRISCFDIEDEVFSVFPSPPAIPGHERHLVGLYALEDCLCLSDGASFDDDFVIWLMRDYGDKKSWTKDFVIRKIHLPDLDLPNYNIMHPLKYFMDGDVLMGNGGLPLIYYSRKTKSVHDVAITEMVIAIEPIIHTPSLIKLRNFVNENVRSF